MKKHAVWEVNVTISWQPSDGRSIRGYPKTLNVAGDTFNDAVDVLPEAVDLADPRAVGYKILSIKKMSTYVYA